MLVSNFANRLNIAMKLKKIRATEIVKKSEILYKNNKINKPLTKPLISHYLKGTYEAKQDNVFALSLILNVDEAWLMGYDVPMEKIQTDALGNPVISIPILGIVKAGYDYLAQENWIGTVDVDKKLADSGELFALKVHGNSMFPTLMEDDIVIVKKQNDFENGDIVVAIVNGDEATIKKAKKSDTSILLQPLNPDYEPLIFTYTEIKSIPVTIIGVVKQLKREF